MHLSSHEVEFENALCYVPFKEVLIMCNFIFLSEFFWG